MQRGANPSVKNSYEQNVMQQTVCARAAALHSRDHVGCSHLLRCWCNRHPRATAAAAVPLWQPCIYCHNPHRHRQQSWHHSASRCAAPLLLCYFRQPVCTAACRHGHQACVTALLLPHLSKAGAGLNCRGPMGLTPLHLAAVGGYSDICTLLVCTYTCTPCTRTCLVTLAAFRWK